MSRHVRVSHLLVSFLSFLSVSFLFADNFQFQYESCIMCIITVKLKLWTLAVALLAWVRIT